MTSLIRQYSNWINARLWDMPVRSYTWKRGDPLLARTIYEITSSILDKLVGEDDKRDEIVDTFHNAASLYMTNDDWKNLFNRSLHIFDTSLKDWVPHERRTLLKQLHETLFPVEAMPAPEQSKKLGRPANPGKEIWDAWLLEKKRLTLQFKTDLMGRELAVREIIKELSV